MDVARSINGVPIRLTYERWYHIVENHDDLASRYHDVLDTVENPGLVVRGTHGTFKAARNMGRKQWMTVVYRELTKTDGFVITAYLLDCRPKGEVLWQQ